MSSVSYLEKLLDGVVVEWSALRDVAAYSPTRVDASALDATSFVGVDNLVSERGGRVDATYLPNTERLTAYEPGDILLGNIRPYLKKVWRATNSGGCSGDVLVVRIQDKSKPFVDSKFLYYLLSSNEFFSYSMQHARGAKMPRGDKSAILNFQIPVPCPENPKKSLEIQTEIVRFLDAFTELTAELTTELATELTARKKQYNYYRDQLLSFEDVPLVQLSRCCVSIADGDHQAPPKSDEGVPFITISNVSNTNEIDFSNTKFVSDDYYQALAEKRKARKNDILYTVVGSFGVPVFINEDIKFSFQRHIAILRPDENVIVPKYLYHVLRCSYFFKQACEVAVGAAQKTITLAALNKMKVSAPSLSEQARIVAILDIFDARANSISEGLPREIELRQKQYAYYRDLLLNFPKQEEVTA
jgi:type I restriction enzyme S subunit